jgi:hypothetical protein
VCIRAAMPSCNISPINPIRSCNLCLQPCAIQPPGHSCRHFRLALPVCFNSVVLRSLP